MSANCHQGSRIFKASKRRSVSRESLRGVASRSPEERAMITIHCYKPEAQCEISERTGEAVEISSDDGTINHAVISIPELTKLLRFRHRQQAKQNGNGTSSRKPPTLDA
jgi:hypothetical protein